MKQTSLIIAAAIIALAFGITTRYFFSAEKNAPPSSLPEFNLPDLSGHQHNISQWRGKILVINFWATWCPSCLKEIPDFIALQQQYQARGLQFIGIALEEADPVNRYIATTNINYPILLGGDNGLALSNQLGNQADAVPYTLVVNQQGLIMHRHLGEFNKKELEMMITPLLK
jgi:thiol-disulfide isomerase/thioredoxin